MSFYGIFTVFFPRFIILFLYGRQTCSRTQRDDKRRDKFVVMTLKVDMELQEEFDKLSVNRIK